MRVRLLPSGLAAALWLGLAGPAAAASFTVNPTQIHLGPRAQSALLTLRNEGDDPIRLQVTAHAWTQSLAGTIELHPTEDLIVFPSLLTIAPGEERRIRVATTVAADEAERSYRLLVVELPPDARARAEGVGVRMLTRVGLPVFVAPARPARRAALAGLGLERGQFVFRLDNRGTQHFVPDTIRVRGLAADGTVVIDTSQAGWYVLAGGARRFELPLPEPACGGVRRLIVDVTLDDETVTGRLETPAGACPP